MRRLVAVASALSPQMKAGSKWLSPSGHSIVHPASVRSASTSASTSACMPTSTGSAQRFGSEATPEWDLGPDAVRRLNRGDVGDGGDQPALLVARGDVGRVALAAEPDLERPVNGCGLVLEQQLVRV